MRSCLSHFLILFCFTLGRFTLGLFTLGLFTFGRFTLGRFTLGRFTLGGVFDPLAFDFIYAFDPWLIDPLSLNHTHK